MRNNDQWKLTQNWVKTVIITIFHIFKKLSKVSLKKSNLTSGEETYNG